MRLAFLVFLVMSNHAFSATIQVPNDYGTIQAAIDGASSSDTVLVASGKYSEHIDFKGKAITVKSVDGAQATIIDGSFAACVVTFDSGEGQDAVLDGFTIQNGYESVLTFGAGIYCGAASPTITNNIIKGNDGHSGAGITCSSKASPRILNNTITENTAITTGGGIYCKNFNTAMIQGNVITKNNADFLGGGICCILGDPVITCNIISENSLNTDWGAGICSFNSNPIITNNLISKNWGADTGGGIFCEGSSPVIANNTIFLNNANLDGGGIYCRINASPTIINNTIVKNIAGRNGGGIYCEHKASPIITNTILWDNLAVASGPEMWIGTSAQPSFPAISYSNVKGGQALVHMETGCSLNWGPGMIDADPLFSDPGIDDYHITHPSPCRNSGDAGAISELYDFEGDPRIAHGLPDMGADEFYTHLYYTGETTPGLAVSLKFVDTPGTPLVFLWLGSGVLNPPMNLPPHGEWRLQFPILLQVHLGSIPPGAGILEMKGTIPATMPIPYDLPLQGGIGNKLTNLCVMPIR